MDATSRRPQLPALSYLDIDKAKREDEAHQKRSTGSASSQQNALVASPSYQFPPALSSLHAHPPPHSSTWPGMKSGTHTPPESRRTSAEEHEHPPPTTRQSLPSISEALAMEKATYPPPAPTSQPQLPPPSTHTTYPPPAPPLSPRRSYGLERPTPQHPFSTPNYRQYPSFRQDSLGPQSYPPPEAKAEYNSTTDNRPNLQVQTTQYPPRSHPSEQHDANQSTSPHYESYSHSAGSMGPPVTPYGYAPYTSRQGPLPPSSGQNAGPIYQPSSQHAAPPTSSPKWQAEGVPPSTGTEDRSGSGRYGDSVKRHLEFYDYGEALNQVAKYSLLVHDFAREFGDRMQQSARSGPSLTTLPSRTDMEAMVAKAQMQLDYLNKIRETVIAQETAYEQQLVEQDQHRKQMHDPPPPQSIVEYHPVNDDGQGGFANPDNKKRRARAAPPGRCHSCNRSETPEWRRGPDGARTLCNACGLHFAKMNRKQAAQNKAATVDSSNLRPKNV